MKHSSKVAFIPIICSNKISTIREIFEEELLKSDLYIEKYPLIIFPEDFNHICYESSKGGGYKEKFSFKRARKILLIKDICLGNLSYEAIYQEQRKNRSICILLDYAEFSLFVLPQKSKKGEFLRLLTIISYGKRVETMIKKQKKEGKKVRTISEAVRLRGSTASKADR